MGEPASQLSRAEDEARGDCRYLHNGTSEVPVRGQFRAWLAAMALDAQVAMMPAVAERRRS